MKFKPKSKDELFDVIKEIVTKQNKISSKLFKKYPYGLKDVDTSLITDMYDLFSCYENDMNHEINNQINWEDPRNSIVNWNVSNVTNMESMFYGSNFNQLIGNWNVSCVTNMYLMFANSKFNQNIHECTSTVKITLVDVTYGECSWNTSNVTSMISMFFNSQFNQPLNN